MKTCEIRISIATKTDDIGMIEFAKSLGEYADRLKAVLEPNACGVLITVSDPRTTRKARKAA